MPTTHSFYSQRLRLSYVDYGTAGNPLLVLVHGGRDHARNWDLVAEELRPYYHVIAPDLRGHGDSAWAIGSQYNIADYVLDLAQLLRHVDEGPVTLVGHLSRAGRARVRHRGHGAAAGDGQGFERHAHRRAHAQLDLHHAGSRRP
jgi:hypothetical protein